MEPVTKNLDTNRNVFKKITEYLFGYSEEPLIRRLFAPKSKKCSRLTSRLVNVVALTASINNPFIHPSIYDFSFNLILL